MRNIKDVLLGNVEQNHIKGEWDITPVVNTAVTVPAIVSAAGLTITASDTVLLDGTTVASEYLTGVARTNITLQSLANADAFQFGVEVVDTPSTNSAYALGFFIASDSLSDAQALSAVTNILVGSSLLGAGQLFHYILNYATTVQAITYGSKGPGPFINSSNTVPGMDVVPGSKSGLLLKRDVGVNNLNIGTFLENSDGTFNDLMAMTAVGTGNVFPDSLRVFVFALSADTGSGFQNVSFKITTDVAPTTYDITGTSYGALPGKDQTTWDASFGTVVTPPQVTTSTQAVFPLGAKSGQFYKTHLDPLWSGMAPSPYGLNVNGNQTILLTNVIPGNEDFVAYVDNESLEASVNQIIDPIVAAQDLQLQTITDLGVLVQQTQDDVNVALLNAPEAIVYIRNTSQAIGTPSLEFSAAVTFDTLDEGYNYLLTLPKFINKRIVLDDRPALLNAYSGDVNTVYNFAENNITLSSYSLFTGSFGPHTWGSNRVRLTCDCSSLRLDYFAGEFIRLTVRIPAGQLTNTVLGTDIINRIQLRNNVLLSTSDDDIRLNEASTILIGEDCQLILALVNDSTSYPAVNIKKGKGSFITLNNTLYPIEPANLPFVHVVADIDAKPDSFSGFDGIAASYSYTGVDSFKPDNIGSVRVIRDISELGIPDASGRYHITSSGKLLFVKSINFEDKGIVIDTGSTVELYCLHRGIILSGVSSVLPLIENRGVCYDHGVNIYHVGGVGIPAILNYRNYVRSGGVITADILFQSVDGGYGNYRFNIFDVDHYAYTGIYSASSVGKCGDFKMSGIRLHSIINTKGYLTLNLPTVTTGDYYLIDNITGVTGATNQGRGVIDIQGGMVVTGNLADIINITNINLARKGISIADVTINNVMVNWKNGSLFNFTGKTHGAYAVEGALESSGTLTAAPKTLQWVKYQGFALPSGINNAAMFLNGNGSGKKFRVQIKGRVLRSAGTSGTNARIFSSITTLDATGNSDIFNITVPLPTTATWAYFDEVRVVTLINASTVSLHISLDSSPTHLATSQLEYSITEL